MVHQTNDEPIQIPWLFQLDMHAGGMGGMSDCGTGFLGGVEWRRCNYKEFANILGNAARAE